MPKEFEFVRETASVERETAEARTFNEDEHTAIMAATVERETAGLTARVEELQSENETLKSEKAELQNQLDVAVAGRETAEQALTDFKAEVEQSREIAARTETRVAAVRSALPHKADDWFTPERAQNWAAMDEDRFTAYVAELAEVTQGLTAHTADNGGRETAMAGVPAGGTEHKGAKFFELMKGRN